MGDSRIDTGAKLNRRTFIGFLGLGTIATAGAFALPALPVAAAAPLDDWGLFLERLKPKVDALVAREGRGVHRMSIEPPRASKDGTHFTRRVRVHLEAGGSLLQRVAFEWDEFYSTRLADF